MVRYARAPGWPYAVARMRVLVLVHGMSSPVELDPVIWGLEVAVDRIVQLTAAKRVPTGVYGLRVRPSRDWEYDQVAPPSGNYLSDGETSHMSHISKHRRYQQMAR